MQPDDIQLQLGQRQGTGFSKLCLEEDKERAQTTAFPFDSLSGLS